MSQSLVNITHIKEGTVASAIDDLAVIVAAAGIGSSGALSSAVIGSAARKETISVGSSLVSHVLTGTDSAIGLLLTPKGTGVVALGGSTVANSALQVPITASTVNYVSVAGAVASSPPTITAAGTDSNIGLTLVTTGTGGVALKGTGTNDAAAAGYVGELLSTGVAIGSAVSLSTATAANIATLSLTAGDWDVYANIVFIPAASTSITILKGSINTTTATMATSPNGGGYMEYVSPAFVPTASGAPSLQVRMRQSVASTTTIYLVSTATFTVSTLTAYGFIGARRVR